MTDAQPRYDDLRALYLNCTLNVVVQPHFTLVLQKIQELSSAYSRNIESAAHIFT